MKRILSFRNSIMSLIILFFFSSCAKEELATSSGGTTNTSAFSSQSPTTLVVNASNWIKMSEGNYKCVFYGLPGYENDISGSGNVKVYLLDQNTETIISNGNTRFMNGELSAGYDSYSVWTNFRTSSENQTLPFSSLKIKIVF